jgi:hypothetical protein
LPAQATNHHHKKPIEGAERDRLYAQQAAEMPAFNDYQQKTTRRIPVVVLEKVN